MVGIVLFRRIACGTYFSNTKLRIAQRENKREQLASSWLICVDVYIIGNVQQVLKKLQIKKVRRFRVL